MVEPAHRTRAETGRPDPSICSVVVSGVSLSFQDVSVTNSQPTGSSEQQPPKDILYAWANAAILVRVSVSIWQFPYES